MDKVRRLVKKAKTNVVGTTLGHTWYWYNDLSAHHKVLASVQLLQHATADLHIMPHNWIGHRINSIHGQKVIHSEQLFSAVDMQCSQFPAKHAKKRKKKKDVFCFLVTEKRKHKVNFVFLWKSILHCEIKRCLDETREKREHTHPCIKWQQAEVNQVNAKTLNRTNHSVLPVHLFTFSIDLIHTHIPSSHPTLRMNHEEKGPWVELIPNTHTHTHVPEIIMTQQPPASLTELKRMELRRRKRL